MPELKRVSGDNYTRVVDDERGLRWWLVKTTEITEQQWRMMQRDPQLGIVALDEHTNCSVIPWETFEENAVVANGTVTARGWRHGLQTPADVFTYEEDRPADLDEVGFVQLHTHTEYSLLDGLTTCPELLETVSEQGATYVGIADHGNTAGHYDLQTQCDLAGIKPVFGVEAYLVDDRNLRMVDFPEQEPKKADYPKASDLADAVREYKERRDAFRKNLADYWHLCLFATDDEGLHNLWAMTTEAFRDGMYGKNNRLDWDTLRRYSKGVIATTACLRGPIWHKGLEDGRDEEALGRLAKLMDIFPDRLYVEIHANQLPVQQRCNEALVEVARNHNLPLVAAVDSHYARPDQKEAHQVWLSVQTNREVDDDSTLFADSQDYHLAPESEVRSRLSYLPKDVVDESIRNTAAIAVQATARIEGKPTPPIFSKGGAEEDKRRLAELCLSNWHRTEGKRYDQDVYLARFEREFDLIARKGFCFTAGTMVTMADGTLTPVEKITPGDLVVTRTGAEPVGRVGDRVADETVRIQVAGGAWPLHTTLDHPFMTPAGWVEAGRLCEGDQVALEQSAAHSGAAYNLLEVAQAAGWEIHQEGQRFARLGPGRWGSRQRKGWCPTTIDLDDDWAYLIGLWVAQGHREVLGTNEGQVSWTLHRNSPSVDRVQEVIRRLGLGEPRLYSKASASQPEHRGVTVKVTNHPLWLLLGVLVGDGAKAKMLHPWLANHPRARHMVDGWFAGDGTVGHSGRHIVDTANEVLARQGRQIMLRSGEWTTTTKFDTPDGEHYRFSWTPERVKRPYGARWDGHRWWADVVSAERSGEAQVYNLTVAGDPSYVAEDVLVHNCGYFLMTADQTNYARANGVLVGPGRGSGGGSLVAYLASITDIDSVDADLPFERFMTEGRTELPDFDIDYPASKKQFMQQYVRDRYGADSVTVVGSVMRLKNKGVIDKIAKALGSRLPEGFAEDHRVLRALVEDAEADTAGLGMSWDDLMTSRSAEFGPYRAKYPELFTMCDQLVGRVNTFGQHAAGMVISSDGALTGRLPMRRAKEEGQHMIAQFDKDVLEQMGFVKFDLLTIRNLDTIQLAIDLIRERRGVTIDPYAWREQYEDPQVWDEVSEAHTLGLFQIETGLGTTYTSRLKPRSLHDLADLVTIVRPGPRNSGLTESYLRRRDGREEVTYPDPRLEEVLQRTYGTLLYQEDIMQTVMILAGYNSNEADAVRKILGKKKVDKVAAAGAEFIERAVAMGMERNAANNLWAQMVEFAKYSFNRCASSNTRITIGGMSHVADTMMFKSSGGRYGGQEMTIAEFYDVFHGHNTPARNKYRTKTRGLYIAGRDTADGRVRCFRIKDVMKQGVKPVVKVTTQEGHSITATADHRHLTARGWVHVRDLVVGDMLATMGEPEQRLTERNPEGVPSSKKNGRAGLNAWIKFSRAEGRCEFCGESEGRMEFAHLDNNPNHHTPENVRYLCNSCHKKQDYATGSRKKRWTLGREIIWEPIASIEDAGEEMTYDLEMDSEDHSWVGNGVVTHNSHAYAYAVLSCWCAWLKFHYPLEFLLAAFNTIDLDKLPLFITEARRMGYQVLPPDINSSGAGFTAEGLTIRYGLRIKNVGDTAAKAIMEGQPYASFEDFMTRMVEPKGSAVNRGDVSALAHIGAFDSLVPNRRGLEAMLLGEKTGESTKCVFVTDAIPIGAPNNLRCSFDWESEEPPVNPRTGKKLKPKPPPKRCTKACRQYTAPPPMDPANVEPYTDADIRAIEKESLGVYLSTTPFDVLPDDVRTDTLASAEMAAQQGGPLGDYMLVGTLEKRRPYTDSSGRRMGFLGFETERGLVDVVCFSSLWTAYSSTLTSGKLYLLTAERTSRGFTLNALEPLG